MPQSQQEIYFPTPCAYYAWLFFGFSQIRSSSSEPLTEKCESSPTTEQDWREVRELGQGLVASSQTPFLLPTKPLPI